MNRIKRFWYILMYGSSVKRYFEEILLEYMSLDASSTMQEVWGLHLESGICMRTRYPDIANYADQCKMARVMEGFGVAQHSYYAIPPRRYLITFDTPLGEEVYKKCIAPRIELLQRIVSSL